MERRIVFGARFGAAVAAKSQQQLLSSRIVGRRCLPFAIHRCYATSNTLAGTPKPSSRKQVTIGNDDGRVLWGQLSAGEKAARTTQQAFNFGVILAGAVGLAAVSYYLYIDVFSSDSKTRHFNRAVDRIRVDPRALNLLGSGQTIRAFGEPTASKWSRNRPIASNTHTDRTGIEHFQMHFNVVGSERSGIVNLHLVKGPGSDWDYRVFALDVPGQPRLYLEGGDATAEQKKPGFKMLGIQWR